MQSSPHNAAGQSCLCTGVGSSYFHNSEKESLGKRTSLISSIGGGQGLPLTRIPRVLRNSFNSVEGKSSIVGIVPCQQDAVVNAAMEASEIDDEPSVAADDAAVSASSCVVGA